VTDLQTLAWLAEPETGAGPDPDARAGNGVGEFGKVLVECV
jgi:hypothetical protein